MPLFTPPAMLCCARANNFLDLAKLSSPGVGWYHAASPPSRPRAEPRAPLGQPPGPTREPRGLPDEPPHPPAEPRGHASEPDVSAEDRHPREAARHSPASHVTPPSRHPRLATPHPRAPSHER